MRLKEGFIIHDVGKEHMVVASGEAAKAFNGLIKSNGTASFIMRQLLNEITEEKLIEAVLGKYDVDEKTVKKDVQTLIKKLEAAGFMEEK